MPQDDVSFEIWKKAITPHTGRPLNGMICINHFSEEDLIPATKSKPVGLKKGAIPSIFSSATEQDTELIQNTVFVDPVENADVSVRSSKCNSSSPAIPVTLSPINVSSTIDEPHQNTQIVCSSEFCQILQAQYNDLRNEYSAEQIDSRMKISNLEHQIKKLKATISVQTERIKRLDVKVARTCKAKESLQNLIEELKQQNLLSKDVANILEVVISLIF